MKKLLLTTLVAAAVLAGNTVMAAPAVDFGSNLPVTFPRYSEVAVAMNPANGTEFALFYAAHSDDSLVLETRSIATGSVINTVAMVTANTNYDGNGEIDVAWSPDGNTIVVGWGEGADNGVNFQIFSNVLAPVGSIVDIADGVNKPKFDFFSDNNFVVAYEASEGIDGGGAFVREYTPAGVEVTSSPVVLSSPDLFGNQNDPELHILRTGTRSTDVVYFVWEDSGNSRFAVGEDDANFRRYTSALAPMATWAPFPGANLPSIRAKAGNPSVQIAPTGEVVIVAEVESAGDDEELWAGFLDTTGAPASANATMIHAANGSRNQAVTARYHAATNSFVFHWNERGSANAWVAFANVDGTPTGTQTVVSGAETSDARNASFDMIGDTAVAVWRNAGSGQAGVFRIFTIVNSTSVNDWQLF